MRCEAAGQWSISIDESFKSYNFRTLSSKDYHSKKVELNSAPGQPGPSVLLNPSKVTTSEHYSLKVTI